MKQGKIVALWSVDATFAPFAVPLFGPGSRADPRTPRRFQRFAPGTHNTSARPASLAIRAATKSQSLSRLM